MTYPSTITNYPDRVDKNASGWYISGEYFNIPSSTPYRMYLDHVPEEAATTHIYASGGAEWTEDLTGSPAAGEFYVEYDVGRVTFNSANAAAAMEARYDTLGDDIMAEHINNMQYEVYAIEGELGWDITGAYSTLSQRLNNFMTITDTVTASQVTCVTPPGASFTTVQGHIDADGGANVTDENPHGLGWNDIYDTDGDMVRAQSNITTGYLYANTISASGNQIGINVDGGEADQWIYFYDGGSAAGEWLKWDDGDNRFEFSNSLFVQGNVTASGNFMPEASGTRNVGSVTEALNAGYFDNLEASNQIWAKTYYGDGSNLEGVIADHNLLNYLAWSVAGHTIDAAITPTASGTIDLGSITLAFNEAYIDKVYLEADPTTTFQAANKGYVDDEDAAADAHITSDGSSHTFIDQSVVSGATPTFSATNFSDGGSNAIVTTTQETNWDNHIADNTQAHSDYLINTGDTIAGVLTPEASGTRDLGSITLAFDNAYMDKVYLEADPTTPFMAATKQYVDDAITGENLWDRSGATLIPHTVSDAVQLGDADTDTGTFTMIKGAQTGDPQFQISLSADDQGDVTLTADTGTISLITSADADDYITFSTVSGWPTIGTTGACSLAIDSGASFVILDDTQLGYTLGDCGTFTMIKGAQTGDPQVQFALSADDQGDFSITTDTGDITLVAADDIFFSVDGSNRFTMLSTSFEGVNAAAGAFVNEAATATNPTIAPRKTHISTGLGSPRGDEMSLIAGGVEGMRVMEANGDILVAIATTTADTVVDATTNGTTTITKAGENFLTSCAIGDAVFIYGGTTTADYGTYFIEVVTSDTALVLDRAPGGTDADVDFIVLNREGIFIENSTDVTAKIKFPRDNDSKSPTISFGQGDTGIYQAAANELLVANDGAVTYKFDYGKFCTSNDTRWGLMNEAPTSTNPNFCPLQTDQDTGIGLAAVDSLSFIAGGVEMMRLVEDDTQDEVVSNEAGGDVDTRIESENVTDAFVMDAGTDTASFGVDLELGNIEIEEDAGEIVLANMAVSDTPASGAPQSYSFQIDDTDIAKVYAEADSAGGIINERFEVSAGFVGTVDEVIATSEGVAASLTTLNTEVTTNGDSDKDIVTLASGVSGQIKNIYCVSLTGTDTWRVTPATLVGGDTIDFDNQAAGEGCTLVFADNEGWIMLSTNGGILP